MEFATPPFVTEFDARPNELFVNYLQYPREIINTIMATHLPLLIFTLVSLAILAFFYRRWWRKSHVFQDALAVSYPIRLLFFLPVAVIIFMGIRSSFGYWPANLSDATFSSSHIVNELAKNTLHSVGYAIYAKKKFYVNAKLYGHMDKNEAISRTRRLLKLGSPDLIAPEYPLFRDGANSFLPVGKAEKSGSYY